MNSKPILFSTPMVRALLEGRKTQTRRAVKEPDNGTTTTVEKNDVWPLYASDKNGAWRPRPCPYGRIGDLLWVRESFYYDTIGYSDGATEQVIQYKAGGEFKAIQKRVKYTSQMKPSIHMPKWASRLTLKITGIRVERLQDITPEDALAEGIFTPEAGYAQHGERTPVLQYGKLWEEIHGVGSWDKNPWVWVIEFEVIHQNIEDVK